MTVPTFQEPPQEPQEPVQTPQAPKPGPPAHPDPQAPSEPVMGPNGFPLNTPWRQMEKDHQVAYWVHQGTKHQEELARAQAKLQEIEPKAAQFDALSEASKSDLERERDAARAEAESLRRAAAEAKVSFGTQLVETKLEAAATGKGMTPADLKTLAGDLTRFLADDGVNGEAVDTFLSALPDKPAEQPQNPLRRDLGGGNRAPAKADGLQVGEELYAQRHRKRTPTA